jgi:6-pyruvoyltetrahydropterin/6-carboxytetrahydropterin synthase
MGKVSIVAGSITCSKRLEWDAAHRLLGHEGLCASLHGHRYAAIIECEARQLDDVGRVIDFGVIKQTVGHWIDTHWDHACILNREDDGLINFLKAEATTTNQKLPYVMSQPTAENMALELLVHAQRLLSEDDVEVVSVTVFETPTSSAKVIAAKVGGWVCNV